MHAQVRAINLPTRRFYLLALLGLLLVGLSGWLHAADRIVVGSKIDTEGALLGNMIAALLRQHGFEVEDRIQLGPTSIVRAAIINGQIDIYPEYTGNGAAFFHLEHDPVWNDAGRGYQKISALDLASHHLVWLTPAPVNNTWGIVANRKLAQQAKLRSLQDFAAYANAGGAVKLAASAEFVESPSALPAFQAAYHFQLRDQQLLVLAGGDTSATNRIAAEGMSGVNTAMAYTTDGAIPALDLVLLADNQHSQTIYAPCPVIRQAVLQRDPGIRAILAPAFAKLSLAALQQLNARIAVNGEDAAVVARSYLHAQGLLP